MLCARELFDDGVISIAVKRPRPVSMTLNVKLSGQKPEVPAVEVTRNGDLCNGTLSCRTRIAKTGRFPNLLDETYKAREMFSTCDPDLFGRTWRGLVWLYVQKLTIA